MLVPDADGWLFPEEADLLSNLSSELQQDQVWCEVGAYKGKSTKALASSGKKGYVIDWFKGSPEHEKGTFTYPEFYSNLRKEILSEQIKVLPGNSYDAYRYVFDPISLLFVDADHSYEGIKRDFELYSKKVKNGGLIVIHDSWGEEGQESNTPWEGVTRFTKELRSNPNYTEISKVRRCSVFRKESPIENAIIITTYEDSPWFWDCFNSVKAIAYKYPIFSRVNTKDKNWYEAGGFHSAKLIGSTWFFILMDTSIVKDVDLFDVVFNYNTSVAVSPNFLMCIGKYNLTGIPEILSMPNSKKEAIGFESKFNKDYMCNNQFIVLEPEFTDRQVFEQKNGRQNMVLDCRFITKWKGTWALSMVKE